MLDNMRSTVQSQSGSGGSLGKGLVMVGYTRDMDTGLRVNRSAPTTKMAVVVVHLKFHPQIRQTGQGDSPCPVCARSGNIGGISRR
jgi:hypothetical protein